MSTSVDTAVPSGPVDDTGRLDGASKLRIFSVLAVIVLFTEVAPMQYVMVSAALRQIAPTFPGHGANINWAIIIFGVIGAAASPLIGKLSDIVGKKRMFLVCGVLFMIGCAICAVTSNWMLFLVGRGLQATAIATAVISYGLIRDLMPRHLVPVGLGIASTGLGVSALAGPLIGGWIVEHYSWRAIFWFLFVFTVVMIPLVIAIVPESKLRVPQKLDFIGAAVLGAGLVLTLVYLDNGQAWGWTKPSSLAYLIGGLALLALFPVIELRVKQPIMDMKLLFTPRVSVVLFIALLASFTIGYQSYAVGYMTQSPPASEVVEQVKAATWEQVKTGALQQAQAQAEAAAKAQLPPGVELPPGAVKVPEEMVLSQLPPDMVKVDLNPGYTYGDGFSLLKFATHIALLQSIISMVFGFLGGLWIRKLGARQPLILALVIFVGSSIAYALLAHTWGVLAIVSAVFGIAFGLYYAATPNLIVEGVPAEQQGISAGMLGVMQAMGAAIGLAVATAFLNANPVKVDVAVMGAPTVTKDVDLLYADKGYEISFYFIAIAAVVALIGTVIMKHGRTPATGGTAH
ncbi:MFS transporter [Nocardia yamanashiensis]|uniref:MFS transporter n=1 Tax=Nocardia yamanashiensis TaxID=209247 RepID=UPI001E5B7940|nr:MFS transporter [Nocardia yamanashiensis]UGT41763.1 MFS transporter [Nocardia yamanashiensis]